MKKVFVISVIVFGLLFGGVGNAFEQPSWSTQKLAALGNAQASKAMFNYYVNSNQCALAEHLKPFALSGEASKKHGAYQCYGVRSVRLMQDKQYGSAIQAAHTMMKYAVSATDKRRANEQMGYIYLQREASLADIKQGVAYYKKVVVADSSDAVSNDARSNIAKLYLDSMDFYHKQHDDKAVAQAYDKGHSWLVDAVKHGDEQSKKVLSILDKS